MFKFLQRTTGSLNLARRSPLSVRLFSANQGDRTTQDALVKSFIDAQTQTAKRVVPWFLNNMPTAYFRFVPENSRINHLMTLSSLWESGLGVNLSSKRLLEDGAKEVTVIRPGSERSLVKVLKDLDDQNIYRMFEFTSRDNKLKMNIFQYDEQASKATATTAEAHKMFEYGQQLAAGNFAKDPRHVTYSPFFSRESLSKYIEQCSRAYVVNSSPRRFFKQMELFNKVHGTEGCAVSFERFISDDLPTTEEHRFWVDQAISNSLPKASLYYTALLLEHMGFVIERTHLDVVKSIDGNVTMARILVSPPKDGNWVEGSPKWNLLANDLIRIRWLDDSTIEMAFNKDLKYSIADAEILNTLATINLNYLSQKTTLHNCQDFIRECLLRPSDSQVLHLIAQLFKERFNPRHPLSDHEFAKQATTLRGKIQEQITDATTKILFDQMVSVVEATYRTNFYMPSRYALSIRVDPKILNVKPASAPVPYGIFFSHGRKFNGFHLRFRDIARGGVRLVVPKSIDRFIGETTKQFDEAWALANAQQLKNKDIPEGGSKAVVLVNSIGMNDDERDFQVRRSFKAFTDSLLDLLVKTDETRANVVDYYGKQEFLYLGPDENVIPQDIVWVINRAQARSYPIHRSFMSSKPSDGINHKEFGVTSEGVNVFLEVALKNFKNIDPRKQPFTVMMTGGPDGDVGGNMIKILHRDYPDTCKVVSIADGTGCLEDPNGLDMKELLRLFHEQKGVDHFNTKCLSPKGKLFSVKDDEQAALRRDTMHFHQQADVFIPAGGRPQTINMSNWEQFVKNGVPNSSLVVEGANLFISEEAREVLYKNAGVLFMKDSSANKCGVICSSFEICSSMLIDSQTFLSIKKPLVDDVISRLRDLARLEAELLVREFKNFPGSLPFFSKKISEAINLATDSIAAKLDTIPDSDLDEFLPLFRHHLPRTLVDLAFHEVKTKIPKPYLRNAFASCLASKIVYQEGIHFVQNLPSERLATVAIEYMRKERQNEDVIKAIEQSTLSAPAKETAIRLLRKGGVRATLDIC
jgi:glutamate dehydrogenase